MADLSARGIVPEYLFWVGCAGAYDDRYKKVVRAFVKILTHLNVSYGVLGTEERCSGDPARRAGNEMLFQMLALQNIETFNKYQVKKILTICPHCFNVFKNEYPDLGGCYEVISYVQFLEKAIREGKISFEKSKFSGIKITYHDPCYLGRANSIYRAPRKVLKQLTSHLVEMDRCKSRALCCGAGGGRMFMEERTGRRINEERAAELLGTGAELLSVACPFCLTMVSDGARRLGSEVPVMDIAEVVASRLDNGAAE